MVRRIRRRSARRMKREQKAKGLWLRNTALGATALASAATLTSLATGPDSPAGASVPADTSVASSYWLAAADGGVFAFGGAGFYGSMGNIHLNQPVVGMAATPDDAGYWLVAADGGVFAFGNAGFYGSTGSLHLNAPIVGMAATPDGQGYWLVAADGGIFAFGDARFAGSIPGEGEFAGGVVGMARTSDGGGYYMIDSIGNVYSFGDATSYGSFTSYASQVANPFGYLTMAIGISTNNGAPPVNPGYYGVASDGQNASAGPGGLGALSPPSSSLTSPLVGFSADLGVTASGQVVPLGEAGTDPGVTGLPLNAPVVGMHSFLSNT